MNALYRAFCAIIENDRIYGAFCTTMNHLYPTFRAIMGLKQSDILFILYMAILCGCGMLALTAIN